MKILSNSTGLDNNPDPNVSDADRVDWIERQTNGDFWVARQSTRGLGFRLQNLARQITGDNILRRTAREAIDAAIRAERENKS